MENKLTKKQEVLETHIENTKNLTRELDLQNVKLNTYVEAYQHKEDELNRLKDDLDTRFESWKIREIDNIRSETLKRSRSVMRGQATEHLAPLMIEDLNPKDFRFMGNPIDYFVADGLSDLKDRETDIIRQIVLLDIKTGKSKLNKSQRRIRDAITEGRVVFMTYNPDTNKLRKWKNNGKKNHL